MLDPSLENDRDYKRLNRTCTTIQANIFSHINNESIKTLKSNLKKRKHGDISDDITDKKSLDLIQVALDSNKKSTTLFNHSQRMVNKSLAEQYSKQQHNLMLQSTKFNKDFTKVPAISKHLANNEVQSMYNTLTTARIDAVHSESPISPSPSQKSDSSDLCNPNVCQDQDLHLFLREYCNKVLCTNTKYCHPYQVASFLFDLKEPFKWKCHQISRHTVIIFLIKNDYVPVQRTTLYCLIALYRDRCLCIDDSWSSLATPGNKPLLSHQGLYQLVDYVKEKTLGGASIPFSQVKKLVCERIVFEWTRRYPRHVLPSICNTTLYFHASKVMSQKVFNIHQSISSKTESCATTENSLRNAISYLMTVASSHFIPFTKPTKYNRPKKDLDEDGCELWDLVQEQYERLFKTSVPILPGLPNLITSVDECTIFATPNKIHSSEKKYLVARPTSVKNENVDSGKLNNYTTSMSGDAHGRGVRIVVNTTFTAGGLAAPIFVIVYGLTPKEMPGNNIVTVPVPGLTVGSDTQIYSKREGFITFVRGKYEVKDTEMVDDHQEEDNPPFWVETSVWFRFLPCPPSASNNQKGEISTFSNGFLVVYLRRHNEIMNDFATTLRIEE